MANKEIATLAAAAALTGTEVVHGVQSTNSRKITTQAIADLAASGGGLEIPFAGFRLTKTSTQAVSAATLTDIVWEVEEWDTESAVASGIFTVPASLDGKYMMFCGGVSYSAIENQSLQLKVDLGAGFVTAGISGGIDVNYENGTWGPFLLNTGDIFKLAVNTTSASVVGTDLRNFFTGWVVNGGLVVPTSADSPFAGFKLSKTSTQAISAATETDITWETEEWDTESAVASGVFTVPASLDGKYMMFCGGSAFAAVENQYLQLQLDTGGGYALAGRSGALDVNYENGTWGPFLLATGDKYKLLVYCATAATLNSDARVFFSGWIVNQIDQNPTVISVSSSRSLQVGDRKNVVEVDASSGAVVLTIDPDATTDITIGSIIEVMIEDNTNAVTITAGAGVDLNFVTAGSSIITSANASTIRLRKRAADSWIITGDFGTVS